MKIGQGSHALQAAVRRLHRDCPSHPTLSHDWTGQGGSLPWPPIYTGEGQTKKGGNVRLKEKFWGTN
jgi:hypothetical protein